MTHVAGVDIGNSTTEIVIIDDTGRPVAWDRMATRGVKGSPRSGEAGARLLHRLCRRSGLQVDLVTMTPQHPVHTRSIDVDLPARDTGRLVVLAHGTSTPGGIGQAAGRPVPVEWEPEPGGDVVLVARDPLGFRATVQRAEAWHASGSRVRGILLAGDEARLVAGRLSFAVPVIDAVDVHAALACDRIALEVADEGMEATRLTDPIALAADLDLREDEHAAAQVVAAAARGTRAIAVGRRETHVDGDRPPATVSSATPDDEDRWRVDLSDLAALPGLRPGAVAHPRLLEAVLTMGAASRAHVEGFARAWAGEVTTLTSEAEAGRAGAVTTPGAGAEALVIDLGGGTIDVSASGGSRTGAGSGELLTLAVADILGTGRGLAEWVKRGPSSRIEAPHVALRESGSRDFLDPPAPAGSVGWLVAVGPSGPLPFTRDLAPAEWRALRRAAKQAVLADNLGRLLPDDEVRRDILLVGGPAGDDELVDIVNAALPGVVTGRADVAGVLGHRWAVAYGLALAGLSQIT